MTDLEGVIADSSALDDVHVGSLPECIELCQRCVATCTACADECLGRADICAPTANDAQKHAETHEHCRLTAEIAPACARGCDAARTMLCAVPSA